MAQDNPQLLEAIRERAENLFQSRQLLCAEAVLSVLNQGLRGGLPPELTVRIASGLPEGLGGSGCLCGALNGGMMALGLFVGRNGPGFFNRRPVMQATQQLHRQFKKQFGSTCCRVLTKELEYGSRTHFDQCAQLTGKTAEMAGRILLHQKPKLADTADWDYLRLVDSVAGTRIRQIRNLFQGKTGCDEPSACTLCDGHGETVC